MSAEFSAFEIRDGIGTWADGLPIDPALVPAIRAAVAGACPTSDRGTQRFVVDVTGCGLFNVDTEELVWPMSPDEPVGRGNVPLAILTDRELWQRTAGRWDEDQPREWTAFLWRVAVPLCRRLGLPYVWL